MKNIKSIIVSFIKKACVAYIIGSSILFTASLLFMCNFVLIDHISNAFPKCPMVVITGLNCLFFFIGILIAIFEIVWIVFKCKMTEQMQEENGIDYICRTEKLNEKNI